MSIILPKTTKTLVNILKLKNIPFTESENSPTIEIAIEHGDSFLSLLDTLKYKNISGEPLAFRSHIDKQFILSKSNYDSAIVLGKKTKCYYFRAYRFYLLISDLQNVVSDIWTKLNINGGRYNFTFTDKYDSYAVLQYINKVYTKSPIKHSAMFNAYHEKFQVVNEPGIGLILHCML